VWKDERKEGRKEGRKPLPWKRTKMEERLKGGKGRKLLP
jgi:hypothetical protein